MTRDIDLTDEQLLFTTVQAARILAIGRTTIYELIKHGELRPVHIARSCRISRAELLRYVAGLDAGNDAAARDHNSADANQSAAPDVHTVYN